MKDSKKNSVTELNKKEAKKRVEFNSTLLTNDQAKKYAKTFNSVRNTLLDGNSEKEITLTSLEAKILRATKDKKDSTVYAYVKINSEMSADYTDKNGKKVQYSNIWSKWSVIQAVAKIANSDETMRKLNIKF